MEYAPSLIYHDPNIYTGRIGTFTIQLRKIQVSMSRPVSYMVIVQSDAMPASTFFMKKEKDSWQIKDKNAALLFGYLQPELNELISQYEMQRGGMVL